MFVKCGDCLNHYDDRFQSEECVSDSAISFGTHVKLYPNPLIEHIYATREANAEHAAHPGRMLARASAAIGGAVPDSAAVPG